MDIRDNMYIKCKEIRVPNLPRSFFGMYFKVTVVYRITLL